MSTRKPIEKPEKPDFVAHTADITTLADAVIAEGVTDRALRYLLDIKTCAAQFDPEYTEPEFPEPVAELTA